MENVWLQVKYNLKFCFLLGTAQLNKRQDDFIF